MVVWAHAYGSSVDDGNDHEFDNDCPCDYNYVAVHYSHDDYGYCDDYCYACGHAYNYGWEYWCDHDMIMATIMNMVGGLRIV